jgi:release factor glutamine methyltransferase
LSNIAENLRTATEILRSSGVAEPRREANSLLAFALGRDKTFLVAHPEYELSGEEEIRFRGFVMRRADREPLQYITGRQEFYGLNFTVTPDVLIPRPETELIVEHAVEILKDKENPTFCEVGVGSGCISASILREIENAAAVGLDVSEKALAVAKLNAENNGVAGRLNLKISDVFAALGGDDGDEKFDLVVSNPPYVPREDLESLQAEVRDFEPVVALTDGSRDGLSIINRIIVEAPLFLKPDGFLLMEIGFNQASKVREMFPPEIWPRLEILPDLQGIPRMVRARLKSPAVY